MKSLKRFFRKVPRTSRIGGGLSSSSQQKHTRFPYPCATAAAASAASLVAASGGVDDAAQQQAPSTPPHAFECYSAANQFAKGFIGLTSFIAKCSLSPPHLTASCSEAAFTAPAHHSSSPATTAHCMYRWYAAAAVTVGCRCDAARCCCWQRCGS